MTAAGAAARARVAAGAIRDRLDVREPAVAIVLGSGLGALADRVGGATRVAYADVPGFHAPAVSGHRGQLIHGTLGGREVIVLAGRFHMYEGYGPRTAAFPVRVVRALGARTLLVSNAAGGLRRSFQAGDLMLIEDHINLMWQNPLVGPVEDGDERFPDMSAPYTTRLLSLLRESATAQSVPVVSGVYAGLLGPSYETPAEVAMLQRLGADAVGMSTVPEAIVAAATGMEVAGISLITNPAAGIAGAPLDHSEVVEAGERAASQFAALVTEFVTRL